MLWFADFCVHASMYTYDMVQWRMMRLVPLRSTVMPTCRLVSGACVTVCVRVCVRETVIEMTHTTVP